ncbi:MULTISPECIES: hypothetical protein [unclassified Microcoleus]|uniref:hypothetical protein n=1 Tax=unclassified Microcoleus TaxID=2642155 RepID=UPI002FD5F498
MFEDIASAAASTEYQPEASETRRKFCTLWSLACHPRRCGPQTRGKQAETWMLEDCLDESIDIATRFVDCEFRADAGKQIDPSVLIPFSDSIGASPVRY